MFPFVELFWVKLYLTGIGIVLAFFVFLISGYFSAKKYNQDFGKFFIWLPLPILLMYGFWLYSFFVLSSGRLFPWSIQGLIQIFNPYGYHFNLIGLLIGLFIAIWFFIKKIKRKETKKIRFDIFFHSFINAVIVLGLFLTLWDNFLGKPYEGWIGVGALHPESSLIKYNSVYPLGIFLSLGALLIKILITTIKLIKKKTGLWILGFSLFCFLFIAILPFRNTPRHAVIPILGNFSLDLYYYVMTLFGIIFFIIYRKFQKNY